MIMDKIERLKDLWR